MRSTAARRGCDETVINRTNGHVVRSWVWKSVGVLIGGRDVDVVGGNHVQGDSRYTGRRWWRRRRRGRRRRTRGGRWTGRWRGSGRPRTLRRCAIKRHAIGALAVVAVTELRDGNRCCRGTGAIEERDAAFGRVGAAVVEVHEKGGWPCSMPTTWRVTVARTPPPEVE